MLRKLMKHELRATSRIMLPLFGIVLLLSFGVSMIYRGGGFVYGNPVLQVLSAIVSAAYGISLGAVFIVVLVLMINRFRTNLLGDEGYIMFTLPVSVHRILWSKIIISCLWFTASILIVGASTLIVAAVDGSVFQDFVYTVRQLWSMLTAYYALHGILYVIEAFLIFFFSYAGSCVMVYAAMAFGQSFARRKTLWSLGFFFGTQFILQFVFSLFFVSDVFAEWNLRFFAEINSVAGIHVMLLGLLATSLLYSAIFYFVTTYFLQKRLNIE